MDYMTNSPYSPMEQKILALLPVDGKAVSSKYIAQQIYKGRRPPRNSRVVVMGAIRSLIEKAKSEKIRIMRSRRMGPFPIEVWREK